MFKRDTLKFGRDVPLNRQGHKGHISMSSGSPTYFKGWIRTRENLGGSKVMVCQT